MCVADNLQFACSNATVLPRPLRALSKMVLRADAFLAQLVTCPRSSGLVEYVGKKSALAKRETRMHVITQSHVRLLTMTLVNILALFARFINDETARVPTDLDLIRRNFQVVLCFSRVLFRAALTIGIRRGKKNRIYAPREYVRNSSEWPVMPAVTYFDYRKS